MPEPRRSVLALAVLSMLSEQPMHVYRMQQLVRERHKDDVVNVAARNSIYQTVERLVREGLVAVESTEREDNRPERTVYAPTPDGRATLRTWLIEMLAEPAREYPQFPAALAFMPSVDRATATGALRRRVTRLETDLAALDEELRTSATFLARVFLVEAEYQRSVLLAELAYTRTLVDDLESGAVTWP